MGRQDKRRPVRGAVLVAGALAVTLLCGAQFASAGTVRVSLRSSGAQTSGWCRDPSISASGRRVAFSSSASKLVTGDTNNTYDAFVHERTTGKTTLVSRSSAGVLGDDMSWETRISANGLYVAFTSLAENLASFDGNVDADVFVHDLATGTTTCVSTNIKGQHGNFTSMEPSISANGRYVAFASWATNIVPRDANGEGDVFVHDRATGEPTLVSLSTTGAQGNGKSRSPSISSDGRYVAFDSVASNLVVDDTNGQRDVFVHDRATGATTRVSKSSGLIQGNAESNKPSISADGRFVAFESVASNLVSRDTNGARDVFVHDRATGATTRVSKGSRGQGLGNSLSPSISADGRSVAFISAAENLVPGDTNGKVDVFVHDRATRTTTLVSRGSAGVLSNGASFSPAISANGRFVSFESVASNLVVGDTNNLSDVFVTGPLR